MEVFEKIGKFRVELPASRGHRWVRLAFLLFLVVSRARGVVPGPFSKGCKKCMSESGFPACCGVLSWPRLASWHSRALSSRVESSRSASWPVFQACRKYSLKFPSKRISRIPGGIWRNSGGILVEIWRNSGGILWNSAEFCIILLNSAEFSRILQKIAESKRHLLWNSGLLVDSHLALFLGTRYFILCFVCLSSAFPC